MGCNNGIDETQIIHLCLFLGYLNMNYELIGYLGLNMNETHEGKHGIDFLCLGFACWINGFCEYRKELNCLLDSGIFLRICH